MADAAGDRVMCHACGGVWPRSEHGLICPQCQSDFTEIVEIPPDPDEAPSLTSDRPDSAASPRSAGSPLNPWADHNPWAAQGDHDRNDGNQLRDSGGGFQHRTYRSPDGRFTFSTTTYTHGFGGQSPSTQTTSNLDPLLMVQNMDNIFRGLTSTYHNRERSASVSSSGQASSQPRGQGQRLGSFEFNIETGNSATSSQDGGLHPRDADGPQPINNPLRTLSDILELFRTDLGANAQAAGNGGARGVTGTNPLAMLSSLLSFDRMGDAVYSQEELDRVISQLIDQTANRGAPPPAPATAIRSLPKKKVDTEMLGHEGRAECSICMDAVEVGTEVTVLPCKHWFHYNCIELWLNQHNTCPHCRRGIDSPQTEGTSDNPVVIADSPEPVSRRTSSAAANPGRSSQPPPGAWPEQSPSSWSSRSFSSWSATQDRNHGQDQRRDSRGEGSSTGSGFTGWVRNRLGGGGSSS
ncbi:hypothetical protein BO82DRAFT_285662 [Aspergillus uvarum CBS 121591]|uniref:RING-type E3 ubiquitin transferase n=1 Tax=Aspergillus uvarum CBS 121591 TaxID=1448315 RepID=A0A319C696_9EURO|nr:hypothetical protein BO82DRAFT_285662 [Aspergillus uvarum CBS 121591]PYH80704.1 hypothetical protein BO82DRAFT_285662 [Aspergillus uvarum CBS 121591]